MKEYGWLYEDDVVYMEGFGEMKRITPPHGQIQKQREALGFTQQEVADAANITLQQYQRFETGERHLKGSSMRIGVNVCKALHVDPLYYADHDVEPL